MAVYRDAQGRFVSRAAFDELAAACGVNALDLEGFILGSAVSLEAKHVKAEMVADYWRSIAPIRGDKPTHSSKEPTAYGTNFEEDYHNSIQVYTDADSAVYVGSDLVPLADWLEYGSIHNPEHGYGARVLAEFGGAAGHFTHGLFMG